MPANGKTMVLVPIERLGPGWTVDRDIYHGVDLLLRAGITLSQSMIDGLKRRGIAQLTVAADSELADLSSRPVADPFADLLENSEDLFSEHGLETAIPTEMLENATGQVETFFQQMELGQSVDLNEARQTVQTIVGTFLKRSHLAVKLLDIDRFDRYTYRHSINAGLLYLHVMSQWADNQDQLEDLTYGAVLHDIGKSRVGSAIINKPGQLTPEEWDTMKMHPLWSAEALTTSGASPTVVSIARSHHERLDGKGYPDNLKAGELGREVCLASICDVYDALTTKRSYKTKMDFAKAIDIILQGCGTQFDPEVAHVFIRRIGRYPAGTFVELSDGDLAMVISVNEQAISRPIVSRVANMAGEPYAEPEQTDLSQRMDLFIKRIVTQREAPATAAA